MGEQVFLLDHVQHRDARRTGQVTAPEGGTQHPLLRLQFRTNQYPPDRKAVPHPLCHSDDVGPHPAVLKSKKLPATAVARLYLIQDQQRTVPVAQVRQRLQVGSRRHVDAPHPLDAFDDDGGHIALRQFGLQRFQIVQVQEGDRVVAVDGGLDGLIVRSVHGRRGAPVERPPKGDDAAAVGVEAR